MLWSRSSSDVLAARRASDLCPLVLARLPARRADCQITRHHETVLPITPRVCGDRGFSEISRRLQMIITKIAKKKKKCRSQAAKLAYGHEGRARLRSRARAARDFVAPDPSGPGSRSGGSGDGLGRPETGPLLISESSAAQSGPRSLGPEAAIFVCRTSFARCAVIPHTRTG